MSKSTSKYTPNYPNRNPIWNFFHINDSTCSYAKCYECGKDFCRGFLRKNTTNMRTHLKQKHPKLFQKLLQLCENERKRSSPAPQQSVVIEGEEDDEVIDSEGDADDDDQEEEVVAVEEFNDDDFFDASVDYVNQDEICKERIPDELVVDETALNALQICQHQAMFNPSNNMNTITNTPFIVHHQTINIQSSSPYYNNDNLQQQQHSPHADAPLTSTTQPNLSMTEEELRKRLLIAQIENQQAQTQRQLSESQYYQTCTTAMINRFMN